MSDAKRYDIAFFGSSLVSSYWNGAATYYRGIIKALARRGHTITFYEPDAFERQKHRDMPDPSWAEVVVYQPNERSAEEAIRHAQGADIIVKASGVGVLDAWLERAVLEQRSTRSRAGTLKVFWDVDAPATLQAVHDEPKSPFRALVPEYDMVLTYGGGRPVVEAYRELGARECHPIYNALDPETHFPVEADPRFVATLGFLGNRLPDREARVEEFFFKPAASMPDAAFLLGGSGWDASERRLPNVEYLGHVYTRDHNAFNCSPLAVLNVNRESMARVGFSPPTRVFEAAGAGACLIMDSWQGVEEFLTPGKEVLIAKDGDEVARHLGSLTPERAASIGAAARRRVLAHHTYEKRAQEFEELLAGEAARASA